MKPILFILLNLMHVQHSAVAFIFQRTFENSATCPFPSSFKRRQASSFRINRIRITSTKSDRTGSVLRSASTSSDAPVWTREKILTFSDQDQGVKMSLTTLGPGYRAVARSSQNETEILGYIEGFVRPNGQILHVDKMIVFSHVVQRVRRDNPQFKGGGTSFGVGLLLGYLVLLHGMESGCGVAEFLAIDDEDKQHKRLVRYYRTAGFDYIKYVGDDWRDIPDRLVWGGCGTLLRKDIDILLRFWTKLLEKSEARQSKQ